MLALVVSCAGACVGDAGGAAAAFGAASAGAAALLLVVQPLLVLVLLMQLLLLLLMQLLLLLLLVWCWSGAWCCWSGASDSGRGSGGGAAAGGGSVLVQGEVGSKNDAAVELRLCEGVCDMKRLAWNCVFQLKDKKNSSSSASAVLHPSNALLVHVIEDLIVP